MRQRAGALILQNHKLLLISEGKQDTYWTPGGGLEKGETYLRALRRELLEELNAELLNEKLFLELYDKKADEQVRYYLVTLKSQFKSTNLDTRLYWYSKEDFQENILQISQRVFTQVFPKLLLEGLV